MSNDYLEAGQVFRISDYRKMQEIRSLYFKRTSFYLRLACAIAMADSDGPAISNLIRIYFLPSYKFDFGISDEPRSRLVKGVFLNTHLDGNHKLLESLIHIGNEHELTSNIVDVIWGDQRAWFEFNKKGSTEQEAIQGSMTFLLFYRYDWLRDHQFIVELSKHLNRIPDEYILDFLKMYEKALSMKYPRRRGKTIDGSADNIREFISTCRSNAEVPEWLEEKLSELESKLS